MFKSFINIPLYKKIIYIFIIYVVFGFLLNVLTNFKFFTFFYNFGLNHIINYIFKDNVTFVGKHLHFADINFYFIYFSFFLFLFGIYLINNSKKIIFSQNFLLNFDEKNLYTIKDVYLKIILACALSLFLELAIIRIHSSFIHYFSFLKNISLISCFLGLGIGYSLQKHKVFSLNWIFPLFLLQIVMIYFLSDTPVSTALLNPISERFTMGQDTANNIIHLILIYSFTIFVFIFNALCFVPIGHLISRLMINVENLKAYSFNLIGSLLGILGFVLFSFLNTPPIIWFVVSFVIFFFIIRGDIKNYSISILSILSIIFVFSLDIKNKNNTIYSPYQNITIDYLSTPLNPLVIKTSNVFYQAVLNLSDNTKEMTNLILPGNVMGVYVDIIHEAEFYNLPYLVTEKKPDNVLIVGSGSGNDVAAANRFNINKISAVEIDPVIADLGKKLHPEDPYNKENVKIVIDDARSFINKTNEKYDVIVYGLLDSQMNLSSKGGIRLDSYVYTIEAFQEAREKINENGFLILSFFAQTNEIGFKIFKMLNKAFDKEPIVLKSDANSRYVFLISNKNINFNFDKIKFFKVSNEFKKKMNFNIDLSTDDWPFLYMPKKVYPVSYMIIISVLIISSFIFLKKITNMKRNDFSYCCFFLGAGFMLIETKCITEFAKIFGTTWLVNAIVISVILIMAFIANFIIMKKVKIPIYLNYLLLFLSIFIGYVTFSYLLVDIENPIYPVLLTMPILFSGIAFSKEILKIKSTSQALSANILGAMFGGFLEYNSMYFGFGSLYILAGFIYLFALLTSKYNNIFALKI